LFKRTAGILARLGPRTSRPHGTADIPIRKAGTADVPPASADILARLGPRASRPPGTADIPIRKAGTADIPIRKAGTADVPVRPDAPGKPPPEARDYHGLKLTIFQTSLNLKKQEERIIPFAIGLLRKAITPASPGETFSVDLLFFSFT